MSEQRNPLENSRLRVGIVQWQGRHGVVHLILETFVELGCQVRSFSADAELPADLDFVFLYGPYGSLVPLANQLLAIPATQRPPLAFFHSEQFPNPSLPDVLTRSLGKIRSGLERALFFKQSDSTWTARRNGLRLMNWGYRFRYYGDLHWLQEKGVLSLLMVGSAWTTEYLRSRGLNTMETPGFGYSFTPEWGADLKLERDIPVLWLGKPGSKRRTRLLKRIRNELEVHDVELLMIDGVENQYVFGKKLTTLLNRTKVVLNILRQPWDDNAARYYLAGLNKVLIITEPTFPHHPEFVPGQHLVEAPIDKISDTIIYYLSHDQERQQIVDRTFRLVTEEHTMRRTISKVLEYVNHHPEFQGSRSIGL